MKAHDPQATSVLDFFEIDRARILNACANCGKCFEVCPMTEFMTSPDFAASAITRQVTAVLARDAIDSSNPIQQAALEWIGSCTGSGQCIDACPNDVNPKMMLRLAKITALGGLGDPKLLTKAEDPNWFPRVRAFARVTLTEQEQKDWM